MKINTKTVPTTFVQIYAPTSTHSKEEIDNFYDQLHSLGPTRTNSKQGSITHIRRLQCKSRRMYRQGTWDWSIWTRDSQCGEKLADFCQANDRVVTNTCFHHTKRHSYTCISPQGNTRNQIDYILVRKSWFTSILVAKTRPGADCVNDHTLTTAKLRWKTFRMPKTSNAPISYNLDRLGNAQTANEYAVTTENRFQVILDEWEEETSTNHVWNDMETIWKVSADEILGKLRKKRSNAWISNETIHHAADKREARKRGEFKEYKRLRNEVQRLIRRDKNSWLENECKDPT